ncbi:MAG: sugar transferase [Bacteroidetes bacterium GWF2_41_31]|nr:MAG: sugar transferase [Bacteroidetes bacterium GWF2_41_31]
MYSKFLKPLFDWVIAFISLITLLPFLLLVGLLLKIESKGPVFFLQRRLGKNESSFLLYKFRTMIHRERTIHHQIFENDPEVTRIGHFLRKLKIDELPQLINVLKGEMSVVGPRPCLPEIKDKFGEYSNYRFHVKPGLTSLAAVNGSIYLTWEQKGYYDYIYTKNISFIFDWKIIIKTIKVIFVGEKKLFAEK